MLESENSQIEWVDNSELNTQDYEYSDVFTWDFHTQGVVHVSSLCWWWCCWDPDCEAHQRELELKSLYKNLMVWLLFFFFVWIVSSAIAYMIFKFKKAEHPIRKALLWWLACIFLLIILDLLLALIYWTFFTK